MDTRRAPRAQAEIIRMSHAGLDATRLRAEAIDQLRRVVGFDAVCFPTSDPATLMITSNVGEGLTPDTSRNFFRVEYGAEDYNKFHRLARSRRHVRALSDATKGNYERSARWREVFGPIGLDDDVRAALSAAGQCWGFLALHRAHGRAAFDAADAAFLATMTSHLAEGLRKALLMHRTGEEETNETPGVLLLDDDFVVVASTPAAELWLHEVDSKADVGELPSPILAAAASLQALERDPVRARTMPRSRLRTASGRWLVVHASRLTEGNDGKGRIAVILELAQPLEIAPLIAAAYGLSDRERQVLQQVVVGASTSEISSALFISANTVQDHMKAIFEKTGVRSRRELVAQIFTQQYLPRVFSRTPVGPDGWFAEAVTSRA